VAVTGPTIIANVAPAAVARALGHLRPRLVERFASRRQGGTGLGLTVAEAHGGTATLAPSSSGASFVMRITRVHTASTHD